MSLSYIFNVLLVVFLFGPLSLAAEETTKDTQVPLAEKIEETSEKIQDAVEDSKFRRGNKDYFALFTYSPIDLIIPSKMGVTVGTIQSASQTWELEYLKGSYSIPFVVKDLGSFSDQRISVIGRSYGLRNSFNFSYGVSYNQLSLELGDDLLNGLSGGNYPSLDLVKIQTLGVHFGLGNRWVVDKNFTFGIDWFSWSQPLFLMKKDSAFLDYATDEEDYKNVDRAVRLMSFFPRLVLFKLQAGISF